MALTLSGRAREWSRTAAACVLCRHSKNAELKLAEKQIADQEREERLTIDANTGHSPGLGILVVVVTGNFLHEHHDPAPHGGIINSHERSDQP
jgi:hypothetical protein